MTVEELVKEAMAVVDKINDFDGQERDDALDEVASYIECIQDCNREEC